MRKSFQSETEKPRQRVQAAKVDSGRFGGHSAWGIARVESAAPPASFKPPCRSHPAPKSATEAQPWQLHHASHRDVPYPCQEAIRLRCRSNGKGATPVGGRIQVSVIVPPKHPLDTRSLGKPDARLTRTPFGADPVAVKLVKAFVK